MRLNLSKKSSFSELIGEVNENVDSIQINALLLTFCNNYSSTYLGNHYILNFLKPIFPRIPS